MSQLTYKNYKDVPTSSTPQARPFSICSTYSTSSHVPFHLPWHPPLIPPEEGLHEDQAQNKVLDSSYASSWKPLEYSAEELNHL